MSGFCSAHRDHNKDCATCMADKQDLPILKNKKAHVSFSEVSCWKSCSWKHKLAYIDGIAAEAKSPYLTYGTIMHDAVEHFLNGNPKSIEEVHKTIKEEWEKVGLDSPDFILEQEKRAKSQGWKYSHEKVESWCESAKNCLEALPIFLEKEFPGWKPVAAEFSLYEKIQGVDAGYFKGYIDSVIELPNGKHVILDWKTAGPRGWNWEKRQDPLVQAQVILYKHYWMKVTGKSSRDIKASFVLLKRNSKVKSAIDIVETSAGPKSMETAEKMVVSMVKLMEKGVAIKNRYSCKYCEYANTPHCT